jgi:hypothetical protein
MVQTILINKITTSVDAEILLLKGDSQPLPENRRIISGFNTILPFGHTQRMFKMQHNPVTGAELIVQQEECHVSAVTDTGSIHKH